MRFFKSRLSTEGYAKREGADVYFVSSEQAPGVVARYYSVRKLEWESGHVSTIGEFQQYVTHYQAKRAAKAYAAVAQ